MKPVISSYLLYILYTTCQLNIVFALNYGRLFGFNKTNHILLHSLEGIPPPTTIFSPVIYEASFEQRNDTIPEISFGCPNLLICSISSVLLATNSFDVKALEKLVSMMPGQTQLTRIFSCASSLLKALQMPKSAVLLTE